MSSTVAEQDQDASELADVERRPIDGSHQQSAQRLALPFALECAAQCERAGERNRNPQDAGGSVAQRSSFPDQTEGEHEYAGDREEERRVDDLATPDLDQQILARDEPGGLEECQHYLVRRGPTPARAPRSRAQALLTPTRHARPTSQLDLRTYSAHLTIPFAQGSGPGSSAVRRPFWSIRRDRRRVRSSRDRES